MLMYKRLPVEEQVLERELVRAIQNKEFLLYYQPQINILSNTIHGFEVLIRWNHPKKGIIYPKDFIPFAEKSGLINQIGNWVLEEACTHYRNVIKIHFNNSKLSVNVSVKQLEQPEFVTRVSQLIGEFEIDPDEIELEITELSVLTDDCKIFEHISSLQKMGISIAIDDFGTGYASLENIKKLSADTVKIDRSFIQDLTTNHRSEAIVRGILAITNRLNIKVIAEGVENIKQRLFLQNYKCFLMQGYLYSPPIHINDIARLPIERTNLDRKFFKSI